MFEYFQTRRKEKTFHPISQVEEHFESLDSSVEAKDMEFTPRSEGISTLSVSILLIWSIIISTFVGVRIGHSINPGKSQTSTCNERYSPLEDDITIPPEAVQFNGSLFNANVFRQPAGPEVDAAWESLGVDYRAGVLPSSRAEKSGLLPNYVQVSPKYGGGFPVNVEGLHHLHCLNLLRKSSYYNYDYYHSLGKGAFKNEDHVLRSHVTHCLDILRQQLMCQVDTGVLGQIWWNKSKPQAFPDFNTVHQCKNFESVRKWAEAHQAPIEVPKDFLILPNMEDVLQTIP